MLLFNPDLDRGFPEMIPESSYAAAWSEWGGPGGWGGVGVRGTVYLFLNIFY